MVARGLGRLPAPFAFWLGRRLGDLAWLCLPRRRQIALANLAVAFPHMPGPEHRRIGRAAAQHLGLLAVEVCRALANPADRTATAIEVVGLGHLEQTMATYGRAIAVTAHLGNWELLAHACHAHGFPVSIIARPLEAAWLDTVMRRFRSAGGAEVIDKRQAVRPVLEALKRGRLVGILLDQNASRREGVFVPMFGRPASTSRGAAMLAIRTGTPLVPLFIHRIAPGRHVVTVHPPILPHEGPLDDGIVSLTAACTAAIEAAVRRAPEQWLWMHARWRTQPSGTPPAS
jgi:KDO2-lipid IV(A) lauroyltransferase